MSLRIELKFFVLVMLLTSVAVGLIACGDPDSLPLNRSFQSNRKRYLYVASGACYAGGVATSTGVAAIVAYDLDTGEKHEILDYNSSAPGDQPAGIAEYDTDHFLVAVENAAGRRVDIIKKDGSDRSFYLNNSTALPVTAANNVRLLTVLSDKSVLISRSVAIEKFSPAKVRVTAGANPWVNNPAGTCGTSATLISSVNVASNGKIIFAHANTTPNNKLALISATGYLAAGDCLASQAAPTTTALPAATLIHSSGHLLVAYGSTTAASNFIYSYPINVTSNSFGTPVAAFNDIAIVNGPSALAEDRVTGEVYVAVGAAAYNTIERFTYNVTTGVLTRPDGEPFVPNSRDSRCVSGMAVMEAEL